MLASTTHVQPAAPAPAQMDYLAVTLGDSHLPAANDLALFRTWPPETPPSKDQP